MLSTAAMLRSLMPVGRLRQDYNLDISAAMQCDVNGVSWLWADLLPAIGINTLTMSINMHRGRRPEPDLNASGGEDRPASACSPSTVLIIHMAFSVMGLAI